MSDPSVTWVDPGPASLSWVLDAAAETGVFTLRGSSPVHHEGIVDVDLDEEQLARLLSAGGDGDECEEEDAEVEADGVTDLKDFSPENVCLVCRRSLPSAKEAVEHMISLHLASLGAVCTLCRARLSHAHSLRKHVKGVHFKMDEYECPYCHKFIQHRSHLNRHIESRHPGKKVFGADEKVYPCTDCCKKFLKRANRDRHKSVAHENAASVKTKGSSSLSSTSKENKGPAFVKEEFEEDEENRLKRHMRPYNCGLCPKVVWSSMHLKAHLYQHTNEQTVSFSGGGSSILCDYCGQDFPSNGKLLAHVESSHAFQCPQCPRHFQFSRDLSKHFRRAHVTLEVACCIKCGQCFDTNEELANHLESKHAIMNGLIDGAPSSPLREAGRQLVSPPLNGGFPFTSPSKAKVIASPSCKMLSGFYGGDSFASPSTPVEGSRQVTINIPGRCTFCSTATIFQRTEEFDRHVQECHPFKCPLCNDKMVKLQTSVRKHFRHYHPKVRPFFCRDCTRVFTNEKSSLSHEGCWRNRPKDAPMINGLHSSSFSQDANMLLTAEGEVSSEIIVANGHAVTARRESPLTPSKRRLSTDNIEPSSRDPFPCRSCPESFSSGPDLLDHVSDSHLYKCPLCEKEYSGPRSVRKHCRNFHDRGISVCRYCALVFFKLSERDEHFSQVHPNLSRTVAPTSPNGILLPTAPEGAAASSSVVPHSRSKNHISGDVYHCMFCSKTYELGSSCRKHAKKAHNKFQSICKFCPSVFRTVELRNQHVAEFHSGFNRCQLDQLEVSVDGGSLVDHDHDEVVQEAESKGKKTSDRTESPDFCGFKSYESELQKVESLEEFRKSLETDFSYGGFALDDASNQ